MGWVSDPTFDRHKTTFGVTMTSGEHVKTGGYVVDTWGDLY